MTEPIRDKIIRSIRAADDLYYHLVLLVGESGSGKTRVLREVAEDMGISVINLNLTLSGELIELTARQRSLRLPGFLDQIADRSPAPVLLDNIEILFDSDLKHDPLRLLQGISRKRAVVAAWNGTSTGRKISYAEPGHSEYRSYDTVDALIVRMDGTASVDSLNNLQRGST
ncbi:BREX-3 system P-loop-containing protein BrxF [bacterium]|nr:BREX-3 system P-loop-containing protein BrxF [candidate division CSSED10-310 bacterium]